MMKIIQGFAFKEATSLCRMELPVSSNSSVNDFDIEFRYIQLDVYEISKKFYSRI